MKYISFFVIILTLTACEKPTRSGLISLHNSYGLTAKFTAYGARLVSLEVPAKNGKMTNVAWGFDNSDGYQNCRTDPYYGATVGRYANRIGKGKFTIGRKTFWLDRNDGMNSLHGGFNGLHNRDWNIGIQTDSSVSFSCIKRLDDENGR